jgi:hypothetical protein
VLRVLLMSTRTCCPTCGRTIPKPKAVKAAALPARVDMAGWTDDQIFAYFRKISVREDTRFFLRHSGITAIAADDPLFDLRVQAEQLLTELERRASKPADSKTLNRIKDRWRARRSWSTYVGELTSFSTWTDDTNESEAA